METSTVSPDDYETYLETKNSDPENDKSFIDSVTKSKHFDELRAYLESNESSEIDETLIEKVLISPEVKNSLLEIAQKNDVKILKALTKNPQKFSNAVSFEVWSEMRKISHENNYFDLSFELQKLETEKYMDKLYSEEEKQKPLRDVPKVLKELHENIKHGNFEKIQEFVEQFPDFKFCCDENQVCALDKAIDSKMFEIYSFLRSESFLTSDKENLKQKIYWLCNVEKWELFDLNLKYSKPYPEILINKLCNKCNLSGASGLISASEIRKSFVKLTQDQRPTQILEFPVDANFEIFFDLASKSVNEIDPNIDKSVFGVTYLANIKILMGSDENEEKRNGTLMKNFMHLVLFLLYENKCLPYCEGDKEREKEWSRIVAVEKEKYGRNPEGTEEIIRWVFQNFRPAYVQSAELAVRPAHLIARYINEPQKIEELYRAHPELFEFFNEKILSDLKVKNALKIIELNNKFKVIKRANDFEFKISTSNSRKEENYNFSTDLGDLIISNKYEKLILSSNIPQLTIQKLIHEISTISTNKLEIKTKNLFLSSKEDLKKPRKRMLKESNVERIFILVESVKDESLEFWLNNTQNSQVFFICDNEVSGDLVKKFSVQSHTVTHEWDDLTTESKVKTLETLIKYQNKEVKLSEILTNPEKITSKMLKMLCTESFEINCNEKILV